MNTYHTICTISTICTLNTYNRRRHGQIFSESKTGVGLFTYCGHEKTIPHNKYKPNEWTLCGVGMPTKLPNMGNNGLAVSIPPTLLDNNAINKRKDDVLQNRDGSYHGVLSNNQTHLRLCTIQIEEEELHAFTKIFTFAETGLLDSIVTDRDDQKYT